MGPCKVFPIEPRTCLQRPCLGACISPSRKTHFANNEKKYGYEKYVDFVECNISRKKSHYARCPVLELLCNSLCGPLPNNLKIPGPNELDRQPQTRQRGCQGWELQMNRLLFANELVLHVWIFSTGSSARTWSVFCCVQLSRNENQG